MPKLFVPGERLGWIFRDRNLYLERFTEQPPQPEAVPQSVIANAELASTRLTKRLLVAGGAWGVVLVVLLCCTGFASSAGSSASTFPAALMGLAFLGAVATIGGLIAHSMGAKSRVAQTKNALKAQYDRAYADWDQRRLAFQSAQVAKVAQLVEWGAAAPSPGTRRVDIIGGTTWGWQGVITIFGASLLRTRGAMTLVDFTGVGVCDELVDLADATDTSASVTFVPSELSRVNLLSGLDQRQLVDTIVESMFGDTQTGSRADRALDTRVLNDLCGVLGNDLTMARLAAGLRVMMGQSGSSTDLTPEERAALGDLLADDVRRESQGRLQRIEAFLHPLANMGSSAPASINAQLTCLVTDSDGRNSQSELLKDLIVQWLIRRVSNDDVTLGSLVLVGADEIDHRSLERLGSLCERRGIRLVLFFQQLREGSLRGLGAGEVAFMRLAHHDDARQAAEFIGRQHKFVLHQITRTLGGNESRSVADQQGGSETEGVSFTSGGSSGTSSSDGSGGFSSGSSRGSTWSRTRSYSSTRNWSQTVTDTTGSNWSDASSAQRVHEYAVEPSVLQGLPDYAMLLVKGHGQNAVVQSVACDPATVMQASMTMESLPDIPLPHPSVALMPNGAAAITAQPVSPSTVTGGWTQPQQQQQTQQYPPR